MRRILRSVIMCLLVSVISVPLNAETIWKEAGKGIKGSHFSAVAVDPEDKETVFIGTSDAVYKTTDGGMRWKAVFSFRSTGNVINAIAVDAGALYAATSRGLYRSKDAGGTWESIFSPIGEDEDGVLFVTVAPNDPDSLYTGTDSGIFFTRDRGRGWIKGRGLRSSVHYIAVDRSNIQVLYAAADNGMYKSSDRGKHWVRVRGSNIPEDEAYLDHAENGESEESSYAEIRSIAINPEDNRNVFAATSTGLLITKDGGLTWQVAGGPGLPSMDIRDLVLEETGDLYAATGRGVATYSLSTQSWEEAFKGLGSREVRFISRASGHPPALWAATDRGIFKTVYEDAPELSVTGNTDDVLLNFVHEPTIEEIRQAAIIYAEVHPSKIRKWRKAASRSALLPDVRFEFGKNRDWQSSTYFYSTSSQKYTDDDITQGNDSGWSVSATWELGELIWNNDQTSIDSRSRYTVQLRDELLAEVTRLFFERRKLQVAMIVSPAAGVERELENELQLQELTAGIDALTGSYLSKRLNKVAASTRN